MVSREMCARLPHSYFYFPCGCRAQTMKAMKLFPPAQPLQDCWACCSTPDHSLWNAFSGGKCEVQGSMIGLDFWKYLTHCWHCMRAVESSVKAIHCERVRVIPMYPQKDKQFLPLARQEGLADKKRGWKCFKVASGWSGTNDDFKTLAHLHPLLPQNLKGRFLFCCWWNFA